MSLAGMCHRLLFFFIMARRQKKGSSPACIHPKRNGGADGAAVRSRSPKVPYSGRLTEMASSSSWACSMMPGASSNQEAELHLYDILYRQS